MTEIEQQPTPTPLEHPRFQYSLRTLFVLTSVTAVFCSVACSLGFVDAIVVLAAFLVLVGVTQYPCRVHLSTRVVMTIVVGTLLWLNLRPTGWQEICNEMPPDYLDPVSKAMFYRGWPVGPWMLCFHQNLSIRRGGEEALVIDGVFFTIVVFAVRAACEWSFRKFDKPIIQSRPNTPQPQSGSPLAGRAADRAGVQYPMRVVCCTNRAGAGFACQGTTLGGDGISCDHG